MKTADGAAFSVTGFTACGRRMAVDSGPLLMGIVNATPDSFSDAGLYESAEARIDRGLQLIASGADIIDVGGESAVTHRPAVTAEEEIERVLPIVKALAGQTTALVSVDTYKPDVARAAIDAGASIINDISGLKAPELAAVCATSGAALVVMHNRGVPKQRLVDQNLYTDVFGDVLEFLRRRTALAEQCGVSRESLIVDPGPDFSKTPAQTIEVLHNLPSLHQLGYPILLPISRKDFIGALVNKSPRARLAGTLAALDHGVTSGAHIFRVHDVERAKTFLLTRAALRDKGADMPTA